MRVLTSLDVQGSLTLDGSGGTGHYLKQNASGGVVSSGAIAAADVPGSLGCPALYGDGSDGAVHYTTNTTLTRDVFATTLTVDSGVVVTTAGFKLHSAGLATLGGSTFSCDGASATSSALVALVTTGSTMNRGASGLGLPTGASPVSAAGCVVVAGGYGGNGSNGTGGHSDITATLQAAVIGRLRSLGVLTLTQAATGIPLFTTSMGGGGGGGNGTQSGGGGGGSAGCCVLVLQSVTGSFAQTAIGGNGFAGAASNCGGGGGGGGGYCLLVTSTVSPSVTQTVTGGSGGASGGGSGFAGSSGGAGLAVILRN